MEHFFSFTQSKINHHSFMRWSKASDSTKKEKKVTIPAFDPASLDEDSLDRSFMVTALSA